ncbi:MAG: ferric reductase-like transmembrane domain-containing protein [Prevotellaceae bacterium]|jgi:DMSO/TMAO reductase YedYZ heme-binding membrane subunit|nr:ferric reductase-like transmembrane domain-containing protein [Prevotellaceae bacterium]
MVKTLIDLVEFLRLCAPLLTSTAIFALLSTLLAKSIKKHAKVYYLILATPFILVAIPVIARWFGAEMTGFARLPVLGEILRDYIHMGTFGHPLLIIIMYIGALDPKKIFVKKLMSIRKELSIIVGFPVLTHSLIRVTNNFPNSVKFFTNNADYLQNTKVVNELGAGISNFSFILGIVMLAIFLPLWVTSFSSVHRRMGNKKWKKLQKWSYVLYATLFIHAVGIQAGGMINPRGGTAKPAAETVIMQGQNGRESHPERPTPVENNKSDKNSEPVHPSSNGRMSSQGIKAIEVSRETKQVIHLTSLFLIYGSYLVLRLRKAKKAA